jgi:hypothetical protein
MPPTPFQRGEARRIRRSPNDASHARPQPGRDRPEWVVAINRYAWSQSIGIGGRNQSVRADRIEAHIFVAFMAYCLHVTLRARLKPLASGLTPKAVLDKFAAIQMLDVHFPTTDDRTLILTRHTELNADQKLLVKQLKLDLPPQPAPRITAAGQVVRAPRPRRVVEIS